MPNTNPCPTCHAQLDPGTPHTFCARTKEPKARELEIQLRALAGVLIPRLEALERGAALDASFARGLAETLVIRVEALERYMSNLGRFVNGGFDMAFNERRIAALERVANENTGAAPIGASADRDGVVRDSHGQDRAASEGGAPTSPRLDQPDKRPHIDGAAPCSPYKMTDDQRALLANAAAIRYTNNVSGYDSLADHVESLITRAVRQGVEAELYRRGLVTRAIELGGGLDRNATPREERCPDPAASALPMPERPRWLEHYVAPRDMHVLTNGDRERLRDACRYALALESRLAEASKSVWPVTDLNTEEECVTVLRMFGNPQASRVADVLEGITASRDALKAKLAEAEKQVEEERQSHLGASHAWAEAADERDRRQKRIEEITIERDAFKEMLSSERKAKLAQIARVCADRDALRAKLEASESELRRLQVVANEDRAVSDAIRGERDRLRAKLDAMSSGIADEQRSRHGLERRVTELEAKLDGVREALSDAIGTVGGARRSCVGDHYIHSPQVRLDQVDRWRSALAAAENTGDAGRTPAGQCSTDRSTDGQPPTSTEPAVDEPGPVTNPAVSHPSTAPAFEMTFEQRTQLYSFLGMSTLGSRRERESLAAFVTDLVRSELRKAREGWVTREVAERALEQCALEYISGSSVHANAKDYLTAAIRAASKEASDGTR